MTWQDERTINMGKFVETEFEEALYNLEGLRTISMALTGTDGTIEIDISDIFYIFGNILDESIKMLEKCKG